MIHKGERSKAERGWGGISLPAHPGDSGAAHGEKRQSSDPDVVVRSGGPGLEHSLLLSKLFCGLRRRC